MIPCFICGADASTGWTKGFTPAPDSQKMALCTLHDTDDNRRAVNSAWEASLQEDIATHADLLRQKLPGTLLVAVHFTGGGMLSFTCTRCEPTPQGTLRIEQSDGTSTFIPMQHIRDYDVRPHVLQQEN